MSLKAAGSIGSCLCAFKRRDPLLASNAGRDPAQGHAGIAPALDVAGNAANGAHHVLGYVGIGERPTKLLGQLQADDRQDFVEALEDAGRHPGPLLIEAPCEIADQFFRLVGVVELSGLAQRPTDGGMMLFRQPSMILRALWIWQRWIAAVKPQVRRTAFDNAFAPSTMNNLGTAGSSPREIKLSSSAWTVAAFSVAPSTSASGCLWPSPSIPIAATSTRSSPRCSPSI